MIIVLFGPRASGKSFTLKNLAHLTNLITVDDDCDVINFTEHIHAHVAAAADGRILIFAIAGSWTKEFLMHRIKNEFTYASLCVPIQVLQTVSYELSLE